MVKTMTIEAPAKRPINRIVRQPKPDKPVFVPANMGKKLVYRKRAREYVLKQKTSIQRFFDLALSLRKSKDLLTRIREIQTVELSPAFMDEGGVQPLSACRERSEEILRQFAHKNWLPTRVGASLAGGIMLVYRSENGIIYEIETENDLSISCVVSSEKSVLASGEFNNVSSLSRFVRYNLR